MNVGEFLDAVGRLDRSQPLESVLKFRCGRCGNGGADRVEVGGATARPGTPPTPAPKGAHHQADLEIEGVETNCDVQSWCTHDDATVTLEVRTVLTVPIDLVARIGQHKDDEKAMADAVFTYMAPVILQTVQSVGWHCGEVELCRKHGGPCGHLSQ